MLLKIELPFKRKTGRSQRTFVDVLKEKLQRRMQRMG